MKAVCTLITAHRPNVVTKEFYLRPDGMLDKKTTAHVTEGRMEIKELSNSEEFAELLKSLKPNQCLMYGVPPCSSVDLVTEKAWKETGYPSSHIARTKNEITWPNGPGILMLDYDAPKDGKPALSREELMDCLYEVLPDLRCCDSLWWPSTSSCIYHKDEELTGIKGQRLYLLVENASDIPRAGQALLTKLWAKDYGYYEVSKSGSLLERSLFDKSVWQPNRIDFAAGAKCHGNLQQKRGDPTLDGYFPYPIDTIESIPDPTSEEIELAEKNKAAQKALVSEEARHVRDEWKKERINKMSSKTPDTPREQLESTVSRAVERKILTGKWAITVIDNDTPKEVSVLQIIENKQYYHGMLTLDPLEPDYDGGRAVGKLFLNNARPKLHSMAHGGATFTLHRALSRIEIVKGKEREAIDALLEIFRLAPDIYDFGSELVMVGDDGKLIILDEHSLRYYCGGLVQFWQWHKVSKSDPVERLVDPPSSVCRSVLALGYGRRLKTLDTVISAPTLRKNGSVFDSTGYDKETRLLFDTDESLYPVPNNPTNRQAQEALKTLWDVFETFPFVSSVDRAVHLAAILTAAVRPVLPTAPAFAYDAPVQGSGKTLLARCIGILATGCDPDIWPHILGRDDEETRKRLFTAIRSGDKSIIWDNIIGTLDSPAMASFLTSDRYRDRILGKSESSALPNRAMLLLTGNNLCLAGDMARRVLVSRIDPRTDKPFARSFEVDPLAFCKTHRQKMISAALTLIRFYLSSESERPGKGRMASFESWDDWIRQAVIFISNELAPEKFGDVMDQVQSNQINDPDQELLGICLRALKSNFGKDSFSAADVLKKVKSNSNFILDEEDNDDTISPEAQLYEAINLFKTGQAELSTRSLGRILLYRKDRIVDGLCIKKAGDRRNTSQWRVVDCGTDAHEGV